MNVRVLEMQMRPPSVVPQAPRPRRVSLLWDRKVDGGSEYREATLGNFAGGDGVRFCLLHAPTCYRRGPYRLQVEVAVGPEQHAWGCFDSQDQPVRYYHLKLSALYEADAIATVLLHDRLQAGVPAWACRNSFPRQFEPLRRIPCGAPNPGNVPRSEPTPAPSWTPPSNALLTDLAQLALAFGRTDRVTLHDDGITFESDTDHTVMLCLAAAAIISVWPAGAIDTKVGIACPSLDLGRVLEFCVVHDLPEAIVGDVETLTADANAKAAKRAREAEGLRELLRRFGVGTNPHHEGCAWLVQRMTEYEEQVDPAARFARYLDKALPKYTHEMNGGAAVARLGVSPDELRGKHEAQMVELAQEYPDLAPWLGPILAAACAASEVAYRAQSMGAQTRMLWGQMGGLELSGHPPPTDVRCVKCHATSGDGWEQCYGRCPVRTSPHYDPTLVVAPWDEEPPSAKKPDMEEIPF